MLQAQLSSLVPALIGATSALAVACVAAWLGYKRYLQEQKHKQDALLNALFGELANMYEHYTYALYELPEVSTPPNLLKRRFLWSKYGDVRSARDVSEYGFLQAGDIRLLLQLTLRVRNTDLYLDSLLSELPRISSSSLGSLGGRMEYAIITIREVLERLVSTRPQLEEILKSLEHDLPDLGIKKVSEPSDDVE